MGAIYAAGSPLLVITVYLLGASPAATLVTAAATLLLAAGVVVATAMRRTRHSRDELNETRSQLLGILSSSRAIAWSGEVLPDGTYVEHETHGDMLGSFGFRAKSGLEAGDVWMRHVHPEDIPVLEDIARRHLAGESTTVTYRLVRGDGAVQWVNESSDAIPKPGGGAFIRGLSMDVTQLQSARAELERTKRRLEAMLDASRAHPFAGFLLPGGQFVEHYTGPNLDVLLGGAVPEGSDPSGAWYERIHPDDRAAYDRAMAEAAETAADIDADYRIVGYDGIVRWVTVRAVCRPRDDGTISVEGLAFDITAIRTTADELERARVLLGEITAASGAHAYSGEITADGLFLDQYVPANLERLIGGPVPPAAGFWNELVHPADRDAYRAALLAAMNGVPIDLEYRIVGVDGGVRWLWEQARASAHGPSGTRIEGLVFDVTDRREAAAEVRASHALLDRVEQGVYTIDVGGRRIEYANRAMLELLGGEDATGTGGEWAVHSDDQEVFVERCNAIDQGESWSGTYRIAAPEGGWRWLREHVSNRMDGDRRIADGLVYDATAELETRQALDAVRAQMQIAMESVEEVLFSVELEADGGLRLVFASPGMAKLLGGALPDGVDALAAFSSRVHRDDVPALLEHAERVRAGATDEVEVRLVGYDRVVRWAWIRVRPRPEGGRRYADGIMTDVTARREASAEVERASRVDPLTGLFNRRHAAEAMQAELARADRTGTTTGLVLLDLDRFKTVNDTHGHAAGDAVLVEVSRRIETAVRSYDTVARWGGEEFIVLVPDVDEQGVRRVAEGIRAEIAAAPITTAGGAITITASCGGAVVARGASTVEALTALADQALYAAKRRGRDRVCLMSDLGESDMVAEEPEALKLAEALARWAAIREGGSELHAARVADLAAKVARELGVPASAQFRTRLVGWLHDVGKITIPDRLLRPNHPLAPAEVAVVRGHAEVGRQLIARTPGLSEAAEGIAHHQEHWDGSGYPDGLAGARIPIEARIVAAVDMWAVMTEGFDRPAHEREFALESLRAASGRQLDPAVVDALLAVLTVEWSDAGARLRQADRAA
jgi:diguanylate cyclase (GGDEF)-like protein/PAS domain S-box-containing protein